MSQHSTLNGRGLWASCVFLSPNNLVSMVTFDCSFEVNMADVERPISAPVQLDRKLSSEPLPKSQESSLYSLNDAEQEEINDDELEEILIQRTKDGNDKLAKFQLGQFYFERKIFDKAMVTFERIKSTDFQAKYQLGVMYYDGLAGKPNPVSRKYKYNLLL